MNCQLFTNSLIIIDLDDVKKLQVRMTIKSTLTDDLFN